MKPSLMPTLSWDALRCWDWFGGEGAHRVLIDPLTRDAVYLLHKGYPAESWLSEQNFYFGV